MRSITLLTVFILAIIVVCSNAKVTIKGACVDCHRPNAETTTHKSTTRHASSRGRQTTVKPTSKRTRPQHADSDADDDLGGWNLHQDSHGGQHISQSRRPKRQYGRQVIITDDGFGGGYGGGGGGWRNGGGVTTIDGRGRDVVRNADCVGCNIRG